MGQQLLIGVRFWQERLFLLCPLLSYLLYFNSILLKVSVFLEARTKGRVDDED